MRPGEARRQVQRGGGGPTAKGWRGREGGCGAGAPGEGEGLGLNLERQGGLEVVLEMKLFPNESSYPVSFHDLSVC